MRLGLVAFPMGAALRDLVDSWRAAEEAGFDAVWTIDHATPTDDLSPAWDAPSLLVAMAARTRRVSVGVLVFDVLLRHPFHLAANVAVAQALSDGRVRVGLGVGDAFSRTDHEALRLPFPPFADRIRVLEACCIHLPALWRGETVTDEVLGLEAAALGPIGIEPPQMIIGGGSRSVMKVAARHAGGWNTFTQDAIAFGAQEQALVEVEASAQAKRLERSVYLFEDRMADDMRGSLAEFERAGADEAMLVLMHPTSERVIELARRVL